MNELLWLQDYYASCCNEDWEHQYGVHIGTLDNPGWKLRIDLYDTTLAQMSLDKIKVENSETDWFVCWIRNNSFEGRGGANNLTDLIRVFRESIERFEKISPP